jgi:hypothetical protein
LARGDEEMEDSRKDNRDTAMKIQRQIREVSDSIE